MYRYYGDGHDWAWMTVLMPLMWIALIGLTAWLVMRLTHPSASPTPVHHPPAPDRETPEEILDRRFAAGEIDAQEHASARQHLQDVAARHD